MKKSLRYFVFASLFVFSTGFAFGQCTPDLSVIDPDGSGRMDPDTLHVNSGSPASITITVIAPTTAQYQGVPISLHHITVKGLTNQPGWLFYACNTPSNEFAAGVSNCVLVTSSLVTAGLDDTIYMDVIVDVYKEILGTPVKIISDTNGGTIVLIVHPEGYGIGEAVNNSFSNIEPQPNPFTTTIKLGCFTETPQTVALRVYNMVGAEVYSEDLNTNTGENYFNFNGSNLNDGVYFYSIKDENNRVITEKFIKSR